MLQRFREERISYGSTWRRRDGMRFDPEAKVRIEPG